MTMFKKYQTNQEQTKKQELYHKSLIRREKFLKIDTPDTFSSLYDDRRRFEKKIVRRTVNS